MKALASEIGLTCQSEMASENPHNPDWRDAYHYKVTLRRYRPRRQMTVYFSQGYGINGEPKAMDVLDCLASDACSIENARNFEDWASELGYDTDSRKAERIYRVCCRQAGRLERFMGDQYETLLWDTERL